LFLPLLKYPSSKKISILSIIKIVIIVFASIFLIMHFVPYYFGADDKLYALTAIDLANGSFGLTNELMQKYDGAPFVPSQWVYTIHNTAIPLSNVGIIGIATISFLFGGYYGLFFVGPIFTILLFIFSERITTNLFGAFAGLVTLVLLTTDILIFQLGEHLLTNNIFALFSVLGCFYLIKFIRERKEIHILFCSIFLVVSIFVRLDGIIFFPN